MLAINTDMKAPKDVNAVSVTISTNGAIKHSFIGRVTPQGEVLLPATLAIVEPEDSSASIRVRVMAFQDRKPRVLRDVRTTVPTGGRTALLRIPLNFVNDNSAMGSQLPENVLPDPLPGTGSSGSSGSSGGTSGSANPSGGEYDFFGAFTPPCPDPDKQTIIDGECKDSFVDSESLPDFDTGLVGDSNDKGSCFDVAKCFAGALTVSEGEPRSELDAGVGPTPPADAGRGADAGKDPFKDYRPSAVTLDRNACSLQLNGASAARLNLALVTTDTGECVRPGECYVPIDRGAGGWKEESGRVQLPPFVCKLLTTKRLRLATSTETCAAKEDKNPICAPPKVEPSGQCQGSKKGLRSSAAVKLRLTQTNFGERDPSTGAANASAWKNVGFDLDGLCTTPQSTDVCARQSGAPASSQEDGFQGIDNAWGRIIAAGLTPAPAASEANSFLELDGKGGGTLNVAYAGGYLTLRLFNAQLTTGTPGEVTTGTLGAFVLVDEAVAAIGLAAGRISLSLCTGSTLETIKQTLRQAGDLPQEGANRIGVPCNAISLGMDFTGTQVGAVQIPPQSNPCGGCPATAPIDASGFAWKAPLSVMGACGSGDISTLVSFTDTNPNATLAQLKANGVPNPTCRACVFGLESAKDWAPIVETSPTTFFFNRGGCVAQHTGSDLCGRAYQQLYQCTVQACSGCAPGGEAACAAQASKAGAACGAATNATIAACGGGANVASAESFCKGMKYLFEGPIKTQCVLGGPG